MNSRGCARTLSCAALVAGLAAVLGGCAHPRVVTAITSSRDQIKFLYVEGSDQGVIKCSVGADGALSQCRNIAVSLEE
ncbi:MAG TPA: hypothetical protein VM580_01995 [Labilithrix sp.]|nr:hypothetical protein [Labilithrix sp.]